jgi:tetratricopeptide (TPR) repeat protein
MLVRSPMARILRPLALSLLLLASSCAWAGFIRGNVRMSNGQPADHVVVRLRSDIIAYQAEQSTDPQGKFNFDGLPLSAYHLTIEGQGFRRYESHIDISVGRMAYEQITLQLDKEPEAKALPPEGPASTLDARFEKIPMEARKAFQAGEKGLNENDLETSAKNFRKAIELYEPFPEAHLMLGLVYMEQRKLDAAERELQRSTELDPKSSGAYLALGATFNQRRKYNEAEKALTRGLEIAPDVAQGQHELATTYWALGRWQEAEPHARRALVLMPALAAPHVILGNIALKRGDAATALSDFREYLRLDPKGPFSEGVLRAVSKLEATPGK